MFLIAKFFHPEVNQQPATSNQQPAKSSIQSFAKKRVLMLIPYPSPHIT